MGRLGGTEAQLADEPFPGSALWLFWRMRGGRGEQHHRETEG